MKQITCKEMGGPADCTVAITGNTAEETVKNGMSHVTESHPEMLESIKQMSPEETSAWMQDFRTKFESATEI